MQMRSILVALFLCQGTSGFGRSTPDLILTGKASINTMRILPLHMLTGNNTHELNFLPDDSTTPYDQTAVGSREIVLKVALGSMMSVAVAAKAGILPIPSGFEYTDDLIARDLESALLGGALGYLFVKVVTLLATNGTLEPRDSRKLIHTLSAPLYMMIWPLFTPGGRFFAACVPLVNAIRLYLAANGDSGESELANAVSRSGDTKEALGGPFLYVLVLLAAICLFWRENLIGVTALCTMAAGDGMADLVGRRFGNGNKWFFAESKSMAGSLAFWVSAFLCTTGIVAWLSFTGCLMLPFAMSELVLRIALITAACAMIELLPLGDDNWTVPLSAAILAAIFLQ